MINFNNGGKKQSIKIRIGKSLFKFVVYVFIFNFLSVFSDILEDLEFDNTIVSGNLLNSVLDLLDEDSQKVKFKRGEVIKLLFEIKRFFIGIFKRVNFILEFGKKSVRMLLLGRQILLDKSDKELMFFFFIINISVIKFK